MAKAQKQKTEGRGRRAENGGQRMEGGGRKTENGGQRTESPARRATLSNDRILRTQRESAKYAKVAIRTIQRWVKAGMLRTEEKFYIKEELDRFKAQEGHKATDTRARRDAADADYRELKARHMQMELDIRGGKYLLAEDVMRGRLERIIAVKKVLFAIPRKITPLLVNQPAGRIQELLRRELVYAVEVFAGESFTAKDEKKRDA